MTYSYSPTLSQTFDFGDFIEPDIVSVVDASVQRACAEALAQGNLDGDLVRTFHVLPSSFPENFAIPEEVVPSEDPDEFMFYDQPDMPIIPDFDSTEHEASSDLSDASVIPDLDMEDHERETDAPDMPVIPDFDINEPLEEAEVPEIEAEVPEAEADAPDIEAEVPLAAAASYTAETAEEQIIIEMPDLPDVNDSIQQVKRDLIKYDRGVKVRVRIIFTFVLIVAVNFLLLYFLLRG